MYTAFGTVHQLTSSLEITDRAHSCANELLTLTCDATGTVIDWKFENNNTIILRYSNVNSLNSATTKRFDDYTSLQTC